ncbi:MAG: DUF4026 domain-containing protein [Oscillospiraceae bacterium]|nr:DUF4026 domain-containing protein [Oscillospiraceae bacterium]
MSETVKNQQNQQNPGEYAAALRARLEADGAAEILADTKAGRYEHARKLAKRLYPKLRGDAEMLPELGILLRLYAQTDRETGVTVFRKALSDYLRCGNPVMRMIFAAGAYRLFSRIQQPQFSMLLPAEFPLFRTDHRYDRDVLRDHFYGEAKALAAQLDAETGGTDYTDSLNGTDPDYDEKAVDLIYGHTAQIPSAIGAVCAVLPDELTVASVTRAVEADGRFRVAMSHADEQGILAFQLADGNGSADIYQFMLVCQPVPDIRDFRPSGPVADDVPGAASRAEGVVLCIMSFEEKQPDLALQVQLRLLRMICPAALAFLDYTRRKLLPAGWVMLAAESAAAPPVDALYGLQIQGDANSEHLWIMTQGLRCCGLREIEILDATKENFARYCDLLCFAAERFLLEGELPDAGEPIPVLRRQDDTEVLCTWIPASQAEDDYPEGNAAGAALRRRLLGENGLRERAGDAVLYLYDAEAGSRRRLDTLTADDFNQFCYGVYIATAKKTAVHAQERYPLFRQLFGRAPDAAYVCVAAEPEADADAFWMKVHAAAENQITGQLAENCEAGAAGTPYTAVPEQLTDFSVRLDENLIVHPNIAYIALDIE